MDTLSAKNQSLCAVGVKEKLARLVGRLELLPRKIRYQFLKSIVGDKHQACGKSFRSLVHDNLYFGNTGSHIDWHVFFFGCYDPLGTKFLQTACQLLGPETVFWDVGANTGTHTLAVAKYCKAIFCFEPFPATTVKLRKHIEENNLQNCTIKQFGLSSQNDEANFYLESPTNDGIGTFENIAGKPACRLTRRRGDDIFNSLEINQMDLVKIDVEGHELEVLSGLRDTLVHQRPVLLWEFARDAIPNQNEIHAYFPPSYTIYKLGFTSRWTRSIPRLTHCEQISRGNFVALPNEKIENIGRGIPIQ